MSIYCLPCCDDAAYQGCDPAASSATVNGLLLGQSNPTSWFIAFLNLPIAELRCLVCGRNVASWPIASFSCATEFGRYRCKADSGDLSARQIYEIAALRRSDTGSAMRHARRANHFVLSEVSSSKVKLFARKYPSSDFRNNMICCAPSRLGQKGRTRRHGR